MGAFADGDGIGGIAARALGGCIVLDTVDIQRLQVKRLATRSRAQRQGLQAIDVIAATHGLQAGARQQMLETFLDTVLPLQPRARKATGQLRGILQGKPSLTGEAGKHLGQAARSDAIGLWRLDGCGLGVHASTQQGDGQRTQGERTSITRHASVAHAAIGHDDR